MTVVYRLGGSLLTLRSLGKRVRSLVRRWPNRRPLFVVGGGTAADIVRCWDQQHHLGDETAHRLALQAMRINEALLVELLPETRLIATRDEAQQVWASSGWPVLCADAFMGSEEDRVQRAGRATVPDLLPHTWDVTSDSLAAWIALRWPADGLVLIKSIRRPAHNDPSAWSEIGAVDRYFPNLAPSLSRLGWVNLRDKNPEVTWCVNHSDRRQSVGMLSPQTLPEPPT